MWNAEADYRVIREDCNNSLMKINKKKWYKDNWRGVIFLDPYNMGLSWECLEEISKTQIFDVWYLFPFMALNRNLYKDISKIPQTNKDKITYILGTDEWKGCNYGVKIKNRMDGKHMEPDNGLYENFRRLQKLLCVSNGIQTSKNGQ